MITLFDILDLVYSTLATSPVKTAINGGIYKLNRPDDSDKEDIVINVLPVTGDSVQTCIVNVNVHVSDVSLSTESKRQYQPNTVRMKAIADIAYTFLKQRYGSDYVLFVEDQAVYQEKEINQHFYNLRIRFRKHNSN